MDPSTSRFLAFLQDYYGRGRDAVAGRANEVTTNLGNLANNLRLGVYEPNLTPLERAQLLAGEDGALGNAYQVYKTLTRLSSPDPGRWLNPAPVMFAQGAMGAVDALAAAPQGPLLSPPAWQQGQYANPIGPQPYAAPRSQADLRRYGAGELQAGLANEWQGGEYPSGRDQALEWMGSDAGQSWLGPVDGISKGLGAAVALQNPFDAGGNVLNDPRPPLYQALIDRGVPRALAFLAEFLTPGPDIAPFIGAAGAGAGIYKGVNRWMDYADTTRAPWKEAEGMANYLSEAQIRSRVPFSRHTEPGGPGAYVRDPETGAPRSFVLADRPSDVPMAPYDTDNPVARQWWSNELAQRPEVSPIPRQRGGPARLGDSASDIVAGRGGPNNLETMLSRASESYLRATPGALIDPDNLDPQAWGRLRQAAVAEAPNENMEAMKRLFDAFEDQGGDFNVFLDLMTRMTTRGDIMDIMNNGWLDVLLRPAGPGQPAQAAVRNRSTSLAPQNPDLLGETYQVERNMQRKWGKKK
jgi:hypothetical protein